MLGIFLGRCRGFYRVKRLKTAKCSVFSSAGAEHFTEHFNNLSNNLCCLSLFLHINHPCGNQESPNMVAVIVTAGYIAGLGVLGTGDEPEFAVCVFRGFFVHVAAVIDVNKSINVAVDEQDWNALILQSVNAADFAVVDAEEQEA